MRQRRCQLRHSVPQGLCSLEVLARSLRTLAATVKQVIPATTTCSARAAAVEQLFVGAETTATRNILGRLAQTVDPLPGVSRPFLVHRALRAALEGRTRRTPDTARRHHPRHGDLPLLYLCPCVDEKLLQDRPMAASLVLTIAAHREIRRMRQRGQQFQIVLCVARSHLGPVLPGERRPLRRRCRFLSEFHRLDARRQIREPDVVPILPRELRLRHPAWRTPDGPDPRAFSCRAGSAETNNAYAHM